MGSSSNGDGLDGSTPMVPVDAEPRCGTSVEQQGGPQFAVARLRSKNVLAESLYRPATRSSQQE